MSELLFYIQLIPYYFKVTLKNGTLKLNVFSKHILKELFPPKCIFGEYLLEKFSIASPAHQWILSEWVLTEWVQTIEKNTTIIHKYNVM